MNDDSKENGPLQSLIECLDTVLIITFAKKFLCPSKQRRFYFGSLKFYIEYKRTFF